MDFKKKGFHGNHEAILWTALARSAVTNKDSLKELQICCKSGFEQI